MKSKSKPVSTAIERGDHWPETLYRYVEHYKWEPQHLCPKKSATEFLKRIRRQEPPLNFLLNMLCVSLPQTWMHKMLASFETTPEQPIPPDVIQRFPAELDQCQPDVRLESATHRIFLEFKVDAYSDVAQILKYLVLSAYLDTESPKVPWILYISFGTMARHWKPASERPALQTRGVLALRDLILAADLSSLGNDSRVRGLVPAVEALRLGCVFGHTTWNELGSALNQCASIDNPSDIEQPICRMTNDFLIDLRRRGLWTNGQ